MTHFVHHRLDLLIKPVDMAGDGACNRRRGEACLLTVELLDAGSFDGLAPPNQFAQLTQMRGGWNPGRWAGRGIITWLVPVQ